MRPKLIVILGPTASGKSDLAVKLAKKMNGEVISADSRQVYKGLDIGTGKVPKDKISNFQFPISEKKGGYFYCGVPHHLLDIASPKRQFTVAQYQKLGRQALRKIIAKNKVPIICGGTGLYVDSLLCDYPLPAVPPDPKLRRKLGKDTTDALFEKLRKLDPVRAAGIDRFNRRRLVRALEIVLKTDSPVPPFKKEHSNILQNVGMSPEDILKIGVRPPDRELKRRIHDRLFRRMRQGMVREAQNLHKAGLSYKRMEELGLEYRYLARFLQGKISKAEMLAELEKEIWRYAKRQMTWFKRDKNIRWIKNSREVGKLILGSPTS